MSAPRVLFLGLTYAGHRTRFENLERHTRSDARIRSTYRRVTGWVDGGVLERLPLIPAPLRGRARGVLEAACVAGFPRPDVIWTSAGALATPFLYAQLGRSKRPVVLDMDCTMDQMEDLAPIYLSRSPRRGLGRTLLRSFERLMQARTTLFTPWSAWAADGLRRYGVPEERIVVLAPGVDLERWRPPRRPRSDHDGRLQLLFVGGDFRRKGGQVLLEVFRSRFEGRCDLDIVTREPVTPSPGVRVHAAEANSQTLIDLYARADLFVLPTRAECFGIAAVEAMASGLPTIVGNVGGTPDIVVDGETGWLIEPTGAALAAALEQALSERRRLAAMGSRARAVAELRFDGRTNDARVVDLLLVTAGRTGEASFSQKRRNATASSR